MKLSCIIASVNYSDYLAVTLPINKVHFDDFLVITTIEDTKTQEVCRQNEVDFIVTDKFTENGASFDRGGAVSHGFTALKYRDFVLHLDGDIILPHNFRELLESEQLDKEYFYGAERIFIPTLEEFKVYNKGELDLSKMFSPPGSGFGFFQLFNLNSNIAKKEKLADLYPSGKSCRETDWMFRNKWGSFDNGDWDKPNNYLKKLPFKVIHLGRDDEFNSNHFGRVSQPFK